MNKEYKFCPSCKQTKKVSAFGSNKGRPDGLTSYCKMCRSQKRRKTAPRGSTNELLELQSQIEQLQARVRELEEQNLELQSQVNNQKQCGIVKELVQEEEKKQPIGFRPTPTNSSAEKNKKATFFEVKNKLLEKYGTGTSVRFNQDLNCAEVWKLGNFVDFVELNG